MTHNNKTIRFLGIESFLFSSSDTLTRTLNGNLSRQRLSRQEYNMYINEFSFMESMPSNSNFILKTEPYTEGPTYNGSVWITGIVYILQYYSAKMHYV